MKIYLSLLITLFILAGCVPRMPGSITDKKGNFRITFYIEPTKTTQKLTIPIGTINGTRYSVKKPDNMNLSYAVSYFNLPYLTVESDSLHLLDDFFNSTQKEYAQVPKDDKSTNIWIKSIQGYPGREYIWTNLSNKTTLVRRVYLVDHRLYILEVTCKFANLNNPNIAAFFNSFELFDKTDNKHPEPQPEQPKRKFEIKFPAPPITKAEIKSGIYGPRFIKAELSANQVLGKSQANVKISSMK